MILWGCSSSRGISAQQMAASVVEKVRQDRGCHWMICCENAVYLENNGKINGNTQKFPWIPLFSHPFPVKKWQVTALFWLNRGVLGGELMWISMAQDVWTWGWIPSWSHQWFVRVVSCETMVIPTKDGVCQKIQKWACFMTHILWYMRIYIYICMYIYI